MNHPPVESGAIIADYLAHRVSRDAADLVSHVQRITLARQLENGDICYGALLDLFIALGDKGQRLRRRLLGVLGGILTDLQRETLNNGLKAGIRATDHFPPSPYSRLSRTVDGDPVLVVRQSETEAAGQYGVLEEARDLIDSGQIDTAQEMLEKALMADSANETITVELLNLYRHTQNHDAFSAMREKLPNSPLGAQWDELADHFEQLSGGKQ